MTTYWLGMIQDNPAVSRFSKLHETLLRLDINRAAHFLVVRSCFLSLTTAPERPPAHVPRVP